MGMAGAGIFKSATLQVQIHGAYPRLRVDPDNKKKKILWSIKSLAPSNKPWQPTPRGRGKSSEEAPTGGTRMQSLKRDERGAGTLRKILQCSRSGFKNKTASATTGII